jgi:hypothetical protein
MRSGLAVDKVNGELSPYFIVEGYRHASGE